MEPFGSQIDMVTLVIEVTEFNFDFRNDLRGHRQPQRSQESNKIKIRESRSISSIAQLVECWLLIHKVMGSNPAWGRNSFIDSSYSWQPRRPKESNNIRFRVRRNNIKAFAWGWIRTHDLLDEKSTLYQLSYWANMQIKVYVFKDIRFISDLCSTKCPSFIALVAAGL